MPGQTAHEYVADRIRRKILLWEWTHEKAFPNERDLSEDFKVSRLTLRAGIAMLVNEGLLEVSPGSGTVINTWIRSGSLKLLEPLLKIHQGSKPGHALMQQLLWLRRTLYRALPDLLCRPGIQLGTPGAYTLELRVMFRHEVDVQPVGVLQHEELLLCGLAEATHNMPVILLAHGLRRVLRLVALNGTVLIDVKNRVDLFDNLIKALEEKKSDRAAAAFEHCCRLREPQYLARALNKH